MNAIKTQSGLSLIELMVTILLSSLLLLGVLELFSNTSATDRSSNELARVQESGRVALELITREARRVGYQGCVGASITTASSTASGNIAYPDEALDGTDTSLTLHYARPNAAGTFPHRDCNNAPLEPYQITFSNCGDHLCITAPDIGNNQQLVTNANVTEIRYLEPCGGNTCLMQAADANFAATQKLQITLQVRDSRGQFAPRSFTSMIELRNRL